MYPLHTTENVNKKIANIQIYKLKLKYVWTKSELTLYKFNSNLKIIVELSTKSLILTI